MPKTSVQIAVPDPGCWTDRDLYDHQHSSVIALAGGPRCMCGLTRREWCREFLLHRVRQIIHRYLINPQWTDEGGMPLSVLRLWLRWEYQKEAGFGPSMKLPDRYHPFMIDADDTIVWALNQPNNGLVVRRKRRSRKAAS